ncbi:hypothetical protein [Bradyrhizobium sp. OAE829]|uniref:hypothetical protein n=1 Tax=Bradyrhizobium sp. OAE829 TaxID=2663807 RepID=UPI0019F7B366
MPNGNDETVYLVADDFGKIGRAWRETDYETTDLETVIQDLLTGQYRHPIRVVAFNTAERWSEDVSEDIAHELRQRCDLQDRDIPFSCKASPTASNATATCSCRCRYMWCDRGLSAQETGGDRRQGALPRISLSLHLRPRSVTYQGERWIHEIKFDGFGPPPTKRSRSTPDAATTGSTASGRSPTMPGTSAPDWIGTAEGRHS